VRAILDHLVAEIAALAALADDQNARFVQRGRAWNRPAGSAERHAFQQRGRHAFVERQLGHQGRHFRADRGFVVHHRASFQGFVNGTNSKGTGQESKPELSYSCHFWSFRQ
jgi:hypothetical protein